MKTTVILSALLVLICCTISLTSVMLCAVTFGTFYSLVLFVSAVTFGVLASAFAEFVVKYK
jgi:hypothetical protein